MGWIIFVMIIGLVCAVLGIYRLYEAYKDLNDKFKIAKNNLDEVVKVNQQLLEDNKKYSDKLFDIREKCDLVYKQKLNIYTAIRNINELADNDISN